MNTPSTSPADTQTASPAQTPILVWDAPVRLFHWLMVVCFAGAYLSAESERWRLLHISLGYTMAGLVAFACYGAWWVHVMRGLPNSCAARAR